MNFLWQRLAAEHQNNFFFILCTDLDYTSQPLHTWVGCIPEFWLMEFGKEFGYIICSPSKPWTKCIGPFCHWMLAPAMTLRPPVEDIRATKRLGCLNNCVQQCTSHFPLNQTHLGVLGQQSPNWWTVSKSIAVNTPPMIQVGCLSQ